MSESNEALERRVRAALARARSQPTSPRRTVAPAKASKAVLNRHVKMLLGAAESHCKDVGDTMREVLQDGEYSDANFDDVVHALKSSQDALRAYSFAAESIINDLARERDELRAELGNENTKRDHRKAAAGLVAAGRVTILHVFANGALRAAVRDGVTVHAVCCRDGKAWTCDCATRGECDHLRAVQVVTCKATVRPFSGEQTGAALCGSGAVTVKMQEQERAGAEVVDLDRGEAFYVGRIGAGSYSCGCGSVNGACVHADALRFLTSRP